MLPLCSRSRQAGRLEVRPDTRVRSDADIDIRPPGEHSTSAWPRSRFSWRPRAGRLAGGGPSRSGGRELGACGRGLACMADTRVHWQQRTRPRRAHAVWLDQMRAADRGALRCEPFACIYVPGGHRWGGTQMPDVAVCPASSERRTGADQ